MDFLIDESGICGPSDVTEKNGRGRYARQLWYFDSRSCARYLHGSSPCVVLRSSCGELAPMKLSIFVLFLEVFLLAIVVWLYSNGQRPYRSVNCEQVRLR